MVRLLVFAAAFVWANSVTAAPVYSRQPSASQDPAVVDAERQWAAAVAERDPGRASDAWNAAADAFIAIAKASGVTKAIKTEAAFAAMLAVKNALNVAVQLDPTRRVTAKTDDGLEDKAPIPRPLPDREQRVIEAIDLYLEVDPDSDEAVSVQFLKANTLRRFDRLDESQPIFLDLIAKHPMHEVAEYAANLALDSYNRLHKYDELIALAERLRADPAFLAGRSDLGEAVRRIHRQVLRKEAERVELLAHDTGEYDRCGEAYLAGLEGASDDDELLYNASICFALAGSIARVEEVDARLLKHFPKSRLRTYALARLATFESGVGRYAQAADAAEQQFDVAPGGRDALAALEDAVLWRVGLGELDRAARDLDKLARIPSREHPEHASLTILLADALLADGHRADATRRARDLPKLAIADAATRLRGARLLAELACPVALADGLCPQPRDRALVAAARTMLQHTQLTDDLADVAELMLLDFELEAGHASTTGYVELASPSHLPEIRLAAHARLAHLAFPDEQRELVPEPTASTPIAIEHEPKRAPP